MTKSDCENCVHAERTEGRRVYETWMQKQVWIERAENAAKRISQAALAALAGGAGDSVLIFNPTAQRRTERVGFGGGEALVSDIPPAGYKVVPASFFVPMHETVEETETPPVRAAYRVL